MENLKLIRGARLLQWLGEAPFSDLERGTLNFQPSASPDARQNAKNQVRVQKLELVAAPNSGNLIVKSMVKSNSGKTYSPTIQFDDVEYEKDDLPTNVTFKAVDGEEYHINKINLRIKNAKVKCNCLDFYWRFGAHDARVRSLLGDAPRNYVKKTDRPPVNKNKTPGVCKHILKLVDELKRTRLVQ